MPIIPTMENEKGQELGKLAGELARLKLVQALLSKGVNMDRLAEKLGVLLDAQVTKVFANMGVLTYSDPLEDNRTQLQAAHLLAQIFDALPTARHSLNIPDQAVEMIINLGGKKDDEKA